MPLKRVLSLGDMDTGASDTTDPAGFTVKRTRRSNKTSKHNANLSCSQPSTSLSATGSDTVSAAIDDVISRFSTDSVTVDDEQPAAGLQDVAALRKEVVSLRHTVNTLTTHVAFLLSFLGIPNTDLPVDLSASKTLSSTTPADQHKADKHPLSGPLPVSRGVPRSDDVSLVVHRTLADAARRKRNIIVTGLPEDLAVDDVTAFNHLCEDNLPVKPVVAAGGCLRIGRKNGDGPRRLLVRLTSDDAASEILKTARVLRRSNDSYVARNVYINADLSRSQARLAYEARQRRRQSQRQDNSDGVAVTSQGDRIEVVGGVIHRQEYRATRRPGAMIQDYIPNSDLSRPDQHNLISVATADITESSNATGGDVTNALPSDAIAAATGAVDTRSCSLSSSMSMPPFRT
jgi:hypothetical protein